MCLPPWNGTKRYDDLSQRAEGFSDLAVTVRAARFERHHAGPGQRPGLDKWLNPRRLSKFLEQGEDLHVLVCAHLREGPVAGYGALEWDQALR
jgi:hypothetical protein